MKVRLYFVLIILVFASSCGEYDKLLKSTDFELKKAKAKEYYDAGQYVKSSELLTQILPRYRATEEAEELNWMNAQSYYGMRDYMMAGSYYDTFIDQFPFGVHAEEANFLAAMCNMKMSLRPELDQDNTRKAIEGYKIFATRFPNSAKVEESKKYVKQLEENLVEKSYLNAKLYYNRSEYKAAVVALNNSLKEYPNTAHREEMMFLKLSSLYQYAYNSLPLKQRERYQAALDDYYSFMEEFPKSEYAKDVNNILVKTSKFLNIPITDNAAN